jgi:hypothetical protein
MKTFLLTLICLSMIACGGSSPGGNGGGNGGGGGGGNGGGGGGGSNPPTASFAFIQEVQDTFGLMQGMLGTFTGTANTFTATSAKDASGKLIQLGFESITLSPDGKTAAYVLVDGIYTANLDGSNVRHLVNDFVYDPEFSPDGKKIVYENRGEAWVMNADGSNPFPAFSSNGGTRGMMHPTFSNDGTMIVGEVWTNDGDGVGIIKLDGTGFKQLTNATTADPNYQQWDEFPAFTKSGKIVFSRWTVDWNYVMTPITTLFTINVDGSGFTNLVPYSQTADEGTLAAFDPKPLSNGKIVFVSNRDNPHSSHMDLYAVNEDGTGVSRLTNNNLFDAFSTWLYDSSGWHQPGVGKVLRPRERTRP